MKKRKILPWIIWKQKFEFYEISVPKAFSKSQMFSTFATLSLIFIFASGASGNVQLLQNAVTANLQNPVVSIPGKPALWNNGVASLINQIIHNMPPKGNPRVGVFDFKDMGVSKTTEFSPRFKEDFLILLSQVDNMQVKDIPQSKASEDYRQIARKNGLDYFVRGFYKQGKSGLSVWSQLISTETGNMVSSGQVKIARTSILLEDLALLDRLKEDNSAIRSFGPLASYEDSLDHLIALKPDKTAMQVNILAEKEEYQIGESISFVIRADKPGYLILFDISPDGEAKIIFPNENSRNNYLEAGQNYHVPNKNNGIEFQVQGPAGLERLKAFIISKPGIPLDLELNDRFYSLDKNSLIGAQKLQGFVELFSKPGHPDWSEDYLEIFINEKNQSIMRGSRKVPLIDKPQKPIDMIGTMGKDPVHE